MINTYTLMMYSISLVIYTFCLPFIGAVKTHLCISALSFGDRRLRTLPLSHGVSPQYQFITSEQGRNIFISLKLEGHCRIRTRALRLPKQASTFRKGL